jgi:hypothetical protein
VDKSEGLVSKLRRINENSQSEGWGLELCKNMGRFHYASSIIQMVPTRACIKR